MMASLLRDISFKLGVATYRIDYDLINLDVRTKNVKTPLELNVGDLPSPQPFTEQLPYGFHVSGSFAFGTPEPESYVEFQVNNQSGFNLKVEMSINVTGFN
jgi:hypothetical protein